MQHSSSLININTHFSFVDSDFCYHEGPQQISESEKIKRIIESVWHHMTRPSAKHTRAPDTYTTPLHRSDNI